MSFSYLCLLRFIHLNYQIFEHKIVHICIRQDSPEKENQWGGIYIYNIYIHAHVLLYVLYIYYTYIYIYVYILIYDI